MSDEGDRTLLTKIPIMLRQPSPGPMVLRAPDWKKRRRSFVEVGTQDLLGPVVGVEDEAEEVQVAL